MLACVGTPTQDPVQVMDDGIVGRRRELDALRGWLGAACDGAGRLVLCVGEPGIGHDNDLLTPARRTGQANGTMPDSTSKYSPLRHPSKGLTVIHRLRHGCLSLFESGLQQRQASM